MLQQQHRGHLPEPGVTIVVASRMQLLFWQLLAFSPFSGREKRRFGLPVSTPLSVYSRTQQQVLGIHWNRNPNAALSGGGFGTNALARQCIQMLSLVLL